MEYPSSSSINQSLNQAYIRHKGLLQKGKNVSSRLEIRRKVITSETPSLPSFTKSCYPDSYSPTWDLPKAAEYVASKPACCRIARTAVVVLVQEAYTA